MGMEAVRSRRRGRGWILVACALFSLSGCESFNTEVLGPWDPNRPRVKLPEPAPTKVFRAGHWEEEPAAVPGTLEGDMASAKMLHDQKEYGDAAKVFEWIARRAERAKNADAYEDALFWQARSLEMDGHLPAARRAYNKLMTKFPYTHYRAEAVASQIKIGENWLDDIRNEMERVKSGDDSVWDVLPAIHFEKEKPFLSAESNALSTFQAAFIQDPQGPRADYCLNNVAAVNFFRERWGDADRYYTLLAETNPRSPLAAGAVEKAIQAKINSITGIDYDTTKLAEARQQCDLALRRYPELMEKDRKHGTITRTIQVVNDLQAEKDFNIAEYYRRTGRIGSAYFYYEIVTRRYAGTKWAERAQERIEELRSDIEEQNASKP
jgi:outer membrane protein assembly factor BamD (BamD/ComL family)